MPSEIIQVSVESTLDWNHHQMPVNVMATYGWALNNGPTIYAEANLMGEFIRIIIDKNKCGGTELARKLIAVCPVNIFEEKEGRLVANAENEDECTLCELCLQACPEGAITIDKLYE